MGEIGVISDTHGLLRAEALAALRGVDWIIHAGDVGSPDVLRGLRTIAPCSAVRGNNDQGGWAETLPATEVVAIEGLKLFVIHDLKELDREPRGAGFAAVISGHSHRPAQHDRDGVLYFNPGSAGPRRFKLPITLGRLTITHGHLHASILDLEVRK